MPDDAPWTDPVVVPDDLRELQAEIEAYHHELKLAARRRRRERITQSEPWRRFAWPLGGLVVALVLAALVLTVLLFGQPARPHRPAKQRLDLATTAPVGTVGGLLPDVTVATHTPATATVLLRSLRPALLAVVPMRCACSGLLADLAARADEYGLELVAVAPAGTDAELDALPGQLHRGTVIPAFDPTGSVALAYGTRHGVTAVVVRADGTVGAELRHVTSTTSADLELPMAEIATRTPSER